MKSSIKLFKYILDLLFIGAVAQAHTLTIIVIIVIFSQAIINIKKFQYRPSLVVVLGTKLTVEGMAGI